MTLREQIIVRCTSEQKVLLGERADKQGLKPSVYARRRLFDPLFITNTQLKRLAVLRGSLDVLDNAPAGWDPQAVSRSKDAFYGLCGDLGVSVTLGGILAWYGGVHWEHLPDDPL